MVFLIAPRRGDASIFHGLGNMVGDIDLFVLGVEMRQRVGFHLVPIRLIGIADLVDDPLNPGPDLLRLAAEGEETLERVIFHHEIAEIGGIDIHRAIDLESHGENVDLNIDDMGIDLWVVIRSRSHDQLVMWLTFGLDCSGEIDTIWCLTVLV